MLFFYNSLKNMKFLCIGDPHIKKNNTLEIDLLIAEIKKIILNENPDCVVILGDILDSHEKIDMFCFIRAENFLKELKDLTSHLILICGNHDRPNNNEFLTTRHAFNSFKLWNNITIVDDVYIKEFGGKNFVFVPYVPNNRYMEALNTKNITYPFTNISGFFSHQEFKNCSINNLTKSEVDEWPIDAPLNVVGHIHTKERPQSNLYYPGIPLQHSPHDSFDKTVSIVKFEEDNYVIEEFELNIPKKIIVELTPEELLNYNIPSNISFVKLKIRGSSEVIKEIMKLEHVKNLLKSNKVKISIIDTNSKIKHSLVKKVKISYRERIFNDIKNQDPELQKIFKKLFV